MAIYQAPRKRWRLALGAGVIGVLVGLGLSLVFAGDDDPLSALRDLDAALEEAASPLEVLAIHGQEGTESANDPRVVTDAVARTEQRFEDLREVVRAFDDDAVDDVDGYITTLRELARERADGDDIAEEARELADLLRGIVRL